MNNTVSSIVSHIDSRCLKKGGLKKNGCVVKLTNISQDKAVIDFDCNYLNLDGRISKCDYLVFCEYRGKDFVVPVELKKRLINSVGNVVKQLQAGACFTEKIKGISKDRIFVPVLASGTLSKRERTKLRDQRNRIKYSGNFYFVIRLECGENLVNALNKVVERSGIYS